MDDSEDSAVQDFLQILDEHRKNCERQGKYVEAEIAKNRLEELRHHEETRRKEAMRSRQIAERLGVEEAHMMEFQQFNAMWDQKMQAYEQRAMELEASLQEKHAADIREFQLHVLNEPERKPKFSRELLNLRRIQETLAKQGEYAEAHKVKLKADSLEAWEIEKLRSGRSQKNAALEGEMLQRHQKEMNALRKRILAGREEQKRQRQLDLERLLQRYQNVKSGLESQQNLERIKVEKLKGLKKAKAGKKKKAKSQSGDDGGMSQEGSDENVNNENSLEEPTE